jgi:hypothetical protein
MRIIKLHKRNSKIYGSTFQLHQELEARGYRVEQATVGK